MPNFSEETLVNTLNEILEAELSGVVRYTHYSLLIAGPHRIPLVEFMKAQAVESLDHAQQVGEIPLRCCSPCEVAPQTLEYAADMF